MGAVGLACRPDRTPTGEARPLEGGPGWLLVCNRSFVRRWSLLARTLQFITESTENTEITEALLPILAAATWRGPVLRGDVGNGRRPRHHHGVRLPARRGVVAWEGRRAVHAMENRPRPAVASRAEGATCLNRRPRQWKEAVPGITRWLPCCVERPRQFDGRARQLVR